MGQTARACKTMSKQQLRHLLLIVGWISGFGSGVTSVRGVTYRALDYVYPLEPGLRWEYAVTGVAGTVVREIGDGQALFAGTTAFPLRTRVGDTIYSELWMTSAAGWQLHRADYPQDGATVGLEAPLTFLPASFEVGQTYQASVRAGLAFLGQSPSVWDETYSVRSQVEATETVTVRAGTFECIRVRVMENTDAAQLWWLAPGLGAVKLAVGAAEVWELQATTAKPPPPPPPAKELRITQAREAGAGKFELRFNSAVGTNYSVESSLDLRTWATARQVTGTSEETIVSLELSRTERAGWFRVRAGGEPSGGGGATILTLPVPGQLYPAGTRFGGDLFGVEFAIPAAWKGGMRVDTPLLIFGSDTLPGLVLGVLGFAGTRAEVLADESLRAGFELEVAAGNRVRFQPSIALADTGAGHLRGEYTALDPTGVRYWMGVDFGLHPDGGYVVFLGLTTQEQSDKLRPEWAKFAATVKTVARPTNRTLMQQLGGRSFQWAGPSSDWYKGDLNSSASLSSWGEKFAFFCSSGTMEVNTKSTSYVSTRQSGGWSSTYMSMSFDNSTTEYGQFTIVTDAKYGDVMLLATLQGYQVTPVRVTTDGGLLIGQQRLVPNGFFQCDGR